MILNNQYLCAKVVPKTDGPGTQNGIKTPRKGKILIKKNGK